MTKRNLFHVGKAGSTFKNQLIYPSHQQAKEEKSHDSINRYRKGI